MRKKEYEFWTKAIEYKNVNHTLSIIKDENEDSLFVKEFEHKLDCIESELFNYIVQNNYPLKKIPYYLDSLQEDIIALNRRQDRREIKRRNK